MKPEGIPPSPLSPARNHAPLRGKGSAECLVMESETGGKGERRGWFIRLVWSIWFVLLAG